MNRKYELLSDDTITAHDGSALYRIRALRDFGGVKAGELGGYVAGEHNLSHEGTSWVADDALVYGDAFVSNDALVYGDARVFGDALVYGDARVFGDALVYDDALVYGNARVYGDALVSGNAQVSGNALSGSRVSVAIRGRFGEKE